MFSVGEILALAEDLSVYGCMGVYVYVRMCACECAHFVLHFVSYTKRDAVLIMPKDRDFEGGGA